MRQRVQVICKQPPFFSIAILQPRINPLLLMTKKRPNTADSLPGQDLTLLLHDQIWNAKSFLMSVAVGHLSSLIKSLEPIKIFTISLLPTQQTSITFSQCTLVHFSAHLRLELIASLRIVWRWIFQCVVTSNMASRPWMVCCSSKVDLDCVGSVSRWRMSAGRRSRLQFRLGHLNVLSPSSILLTTKRLAQFAQHLK